MTIGLSNIEMAISARKLVDKSVGVLTNIQLMKEISVVKNNCMIELVVVVKDF